MDYSDKDLHHALVGGAPQAQVRPAAVVPDRDRELESAIDGHDHGRIRRLISAPGFDPNRSLSGRIPPLWLAVCSRDSETVRDLLRVPGINPNLTGIGDYPHSDGLDFDMLQAFLVHQDTDVNTWSRYGTSALYWALDNPDLRIIQALIEDQRTNIYLDLGDTQGRNIVELAIDIDRNDVIQLLRKDGRFGPMFNQLDARRKGKMELLAHTPNADLLIQAIYENNINDIPELLERDDVDPSAKVHRIRPSNNISLLKLAIKRKAVEAVEFLLKSQKIDPNAIFDDQEAGWFSCPVEIVNLLVEDARVSPQWWGTLMAMSGMYGQFQQLVARQNGAAQQAAGPAAQEPGRPQAWRQAHENMQSPEPEEPPRPGM